MKLIKKTIDVFFFLLIFINFVVAQPTNSGTSDSKQVSFKKKNSNQNNYTNNQKNEINSSEIGVSNAKPFPSRKKANLDWVTPLGSSISVSGGMVEIALKITAPDKVKAENIIVYLNNKRQDSKANETDLFGNDGEFNYKNKVKLVQGVNKIEVAIETSDMKRRSSAKIIEYNNGIAKVSSEEQESSNQQQLSIFWKTPDPVMLQGKPLVHKATLLDISIGLTSTQPLIKENLTLVINNNYLSPSKSSLLTNVGNQYSYTDQILLDDKISINEVFVQAMKGNNRAKTSTLKINYSPEKPNLYVLSIGVRSNLQYTVNDANDFTDLFSGQGGREGNRLFNAIQTEKLLGDDATADAIKKKIIDLKIKMETGNISKDDLILVFISTHGFMMGEDFRLEGNDYEARYKDITSVSYQKDILARLNEIPCKKAMFIDACHSGGAKADAANVNYALAEYRKIPTGISVITSSQEDEQSYEDDAWENGAFTEAIVKGLQNAEADNDDNKIITIKELYDFLNKEVPSMVNKTKGKVQRPAMPKKDLENIGIFVVNE